MTESLFIFSKDVAKLLKCSEANALTLLKKGFIKCCIWNNSEYRTRVKYVEEFIDKISNNELEVHDPAVFTVVHSIQQHIDIDDYAKGIVDTVVRNELEKQSQKEKTKRNKLSV